MSMYSKRLSLNLEQRKRRQSKDKNEEKLQDDQYTLNGFKSAQESPDSLYFRAQQKEDHVQSTPLLLTNANKQNQSRNFQQNKTYSLFQTSSSRTLQNTERITCNSQNQFSIDDQIIRNQKSITQKNAYTENFINYSKRTSLFQTQSNLETNQSSKKLVQPKQSVQTLAYNKNGQSPQNNNSNQTEQKQIQMSNSLKSFRQLLNDKFGNTPENPSKNIKRDVKTAVQSENKIRDRLQLRDRVGKSEYLQPFDEQNQSSEFLRREYKETKSLKSLRNQRDGSSSSRRFMDKIQETREKIQSSLGFSLLPKHNLIDSENNSPLKQTQIEKATEILKDQNQFNKFQAEYNQEKNFQFQQILQTFPKQNEKFDKEEDIENLNQRIKRLELENQKHKQLIDQLSKKLNLQSSNSNPITNSQKELSPIRLEEMYSSIFSTNNHDEEELYKALQLSKSNSKQNSTKNLVHLLQSTQRKESQDTPQFTRSNTQLDTNHQHSPFIIQENLNQNNSPLYKQLDNKNIENKTIIQKPNKINTLLKPEKEIQEIYIDQENDQYINSPFSKESPQKIQRQSLGSGSGQYYSPELELLSVDYKHRRKNSQERASRKRQKEHQQIFEQKKQNVDQKQEKRAESQQRKNHQQIINKLKQREQFQQAIKEKINQKFQSIIQDLNQNENLSSSSKSKEEQINNRVLRKNDREERIQKLKSDIIPNIKKPQSRTTKINQGLKILIQIILVKKGFEFLVRQSKQVNIVNKLKHVIERVEKRNILVKTKKAFEQFKYYQRQSRLDQQKIKTGIRLLNWIMNRKSQFYKLQAFANINQQKLKKVRFQEEQKTKQEMTFVENPLISAVQQNSNELPSKESVNIVINTQQAPSLMNLQANSNIKIKPIKNIQLDLSDKVTLQKIIKKSSSSPQNASSAFNQPSQLSGKLNKQLSSTALKQVQGKIQQNTNFKQKLNNANSRSRSPSSINPKPTNNLTQKISQNISQKSMFNRRLTR